MIPTSTPASPPIFRLKAARQPMLWTALFYPLGSVAGVYPWRPAFWLIVAVSAFLTAAAYFAPRRAGSPGFSL